MAWGDTQKALTEGKEKIMVHVRTITAACSSQRWHDSRTVVTVRVFVI